MGALELSSDYNSCGDATNVFRSPNETCSCAMVCASCHKRDNEFVLGGEKEKQLPLGHISIHVFCITCTNVMTKLERKVKECCGCLKRYCYRNECSGCKVMFHNHRYVGSHNAKIAHKLWILRQFGLQWMPWVLSSSNTRDESSLHLWSWTFMWYCLLRILKLHEQCFDICMCCNEEAAGIINAKMTGAIQCNVLIVMTTTTVTPWAQEPVKSLEGLAVLEHTKVTTRGSSPPRGAGEGLGSYRQGS